MLKRCLLLLLCCSFALLRADEGDPVGMGIFENIPEIQEVSEGSHSRLDLSLGYTYRSPRSTYNSIEEFNIAYYYKYSRAFTLYMAMAGFTRDEGQGLLGNVGAYCDWGDRIYTFSCVTKGTNCPYLPNYRFDQDVYLKLLKKRNLVVVAGVTYFRFFGANRELTLSAGAHYYSGSWLIGYRLFRHRANPGSFNSYSSKIQLTYGTEGVSSTNLDFLWGKLSYLATYLALPEDVNLNSQTVAFSHRHWLRKGMGIYGEASYTYINAPYSAYRVALGMFKEF